MNTDNNAKKCPICGSEGVYITPDIDKKRNLYYYECPNCGEFFVLHNGSYENTLSNKYNITKLKSYLFYHKSEKRAVLLNRERYEEYITDERVNVYNLTSEMVENWYPKNFNEKIDMILLWMANESQYMGDSVLIHRDHFTSLFFMQNSFIENNGIIQKEYQLAKNELLFIVNYLVKNRLINEYNDNYKPEKVYELCQNILNCRKMGIVLTDVAWQKIYDLQKNRLNNKNVFVAMKFGEDTKELREKIKEGLEGYNVRIMDEIEHNHQIVPEMLYEIRNSKFVIAELSHHNNGAYYEAGYALGLGKEVIHICQKDELLNGLHFDVAQVNTVVYEDIKEIPEKLKKRTQATIG
ncbi:MAG: Lar family restriction alleviation protein [Treponemataceae bacterium]|nr:Lar family restriction alleviation protein [Treponemataceae bacterium]